MTPSVCATAIGWGRDVGDVALNWNLNSADIGLVGDDVGTDEGLQTAVILSLFTDRRAADDDSEAVADHRRGWWADEFAAEDGDQIGSRLWLLDRAKTGADLGLRVEEYVREALAWMLRDEVVERIDVTTETRGQALGMEVTLHRPGGTPFTMRFDNVWQALKGPITGGGAVQDIWTPAMIPDLACWLSDDDVTVTGVNVDSWNDKINAKHFAYVSGNRAVRQFNAQNGRPGIYFDGSGSGPNMPHLRRAAFLSGSQQAEAFVVLRSDMGGGSANFSWGGFGNADVVHYPFSDDNVYEDWGNSVRSSFAGGATTRAAGIYNISAGSGAGAWVARLNGVQKVTATGTPTWASTFTLGSYHTPSPGYQGFKGWLFEVIVFGRVLTTTERTLVKQWLASKWAIVVS